MKRLLRQMWFKVPLITAIIGTVITTPMLYSGALTRIFDGKFWNEIGFIIYAPLFVIATKIMVSVPLFRSLQWMNSMYLILDAFYNGLIFFVLALYFYGMVRLYLMIKFLVLSRQTDASSLEKGEESIG
jgi:hypothetical protein